MESDVTKSAQSESERLQRFEKLLGYVNSAEHNRKWAERLMALAVKGGADSDEHMPTLKFGFGYLKYLEHKVSDQRRLLHRDFPDMEEQARLSQVLHIRKLTRPEIE